MMKHLEDEIGGQFGASTRIRCLAHVLNLVVKAMLLPFTKGTKGGGNNDDSDSDNDEPKTKKKDKNTTAGRLFQMRLVRDSNHLLVLALTDFP